MRSFIQLQLNACMHSVNAVLLLGDTFLNCLVILIPHCYWWCSFLFLNGQLPILFLSAVPHLSDCIFYFVDLYICHLSVDHPCLYLDVVKLYYQFFHVIYLCLSFCALWSCFFFPLFTGGHIHFLTCHPLMLPYGMHFFSVSFPIIME